MVSALLHSLPAMLNVAALLFLTFFVFAILGMTLFSNVRYGEYLNHHANFRDWVSAMLLLTRVCTGENWHLIMKDCQVQWPQCTDWNGQATNGWGSLDESDPYFGPNREYYLMNDCGSSFLAGLYFITFYMLSSYAVINLFVAVILDNFAFCANVDHAEITDFHLRQFKDVWFKYTANETMTKGKKKSDGRHLPVWALRPLMLDLGYPLGIVAWNMKGKARYRMVQLRCVDFTGKHGIPYVDLLMLLAGHALKWEEGQLPYGETMERKKEQEKLSENVAAKMFQAMWRGVLKRRAMGITKGASQGTRAASGSKSPEETFRARFLKRLNGEEALADASPMSNSTSISATNAPVEVPMLNLNPTRSPVNEFQHEDDRGNSVATSGQMPDPVGAPRPTLASPRALTSPSSDVHSTESAAVEIHEVRNLFRERAAKRKKKKTQMEAASPRGTDPGRMIVI